MVPPPAPQPVEELDRLTALVRAASAGVAFTGAGVSTDSGIPDFRSPTGLWARFDPRDFTFEAYVRSADQRRRSWAMRREFWAAEPRPNAAHLAIAELERRGHLQGVVTQNIDGLHQEAGSRTVAELHGTSRTVHCIGHAPAGGRPSGCGFHADTVWAFDRIDAGVDDPMCPSCGGLVKSATISFGQMLDDDTLAQAGQMTASADLVLAVGTSLEVHPAAALPAAAVAAGTPLAIVNHTATPLDGSATVVVHAGAATLAQVVRRLDAPGDDPPQ